MGSSSSKESPLYPHIPSRSTCDSIYEYHSKVKAYKAACDWQRYLGDRNNLEKEYQSLRYQWLAVHGYHSDSDESSSDCNHFACEDNSNQVEHRQPCRNHRQKHPKHRHKHPKHLFPPLHEQPVYEQQAYEQPAYEQPANKCCDPPAYSPTSAPLAPQSTNSYAVVWQVSQDGPILDIAFTPGGEHVVAVVKARGALGAAQELRIWDTQSARPVYVQERSQQGSSGVGSGLQGSSFQSHNTPNRSISGSLIISSCWRESLLRPDDRFFPWKLDLVDLDPRAIVPFEVPKEIWLPIVASPNPSYFPGFDQVLVGVDSACKSVIRVAGSASNGARFDKYFDLRCGEITHLAFTPYGSAVMSLSEYGVCQFTTIKDGHSSEMHIRSNHQADMLQYGQRQLPDHASSSGFTTHYHVVSVWGPDVAIWHWVDYQDGSFTNNLEMYNLNETLGRRVTPLCITYDGLYLACASDDGFDIIEVVTGNWVMGTSSKGEGPFGICKAAFSPNGKIIIVCTHERTLHRFGLSLY